MNGESERDEEALRVMSAFYKIADPELRRIIIDIVEAAAQCGTWTPHEVRSKLS
jgi:hypothetical protein